MSKGLITEAKVASFEKHFVQAMGDPANVRPVLRKLETAVSCAVRANLQPSLERLERLCIMLLGADDEGAREAAVRLLNTIYDGHTWQAKEALVKRRRRVSSCSLLICSQIHNRSRPCATLGTVSSWNWM